MLDCICPGVMIGQLIGRWGNFMNAEAYGVMSIPTLFVIRDGKAVKKSMGALPKAQLLQLME